MAKQPRGGTGQLSERGIMAMFFQVLETPTDQSWIERVSRYVESDQEIEVYRDLGQVPRMKVFQGSKDVEQLKKYELEIRNEEFDVTIGIPTRDIRRDKTGLIEERVNDLYDASITHWTDLGSGLIVNGHLADCYDGKKYFAANHQSGKSPVQSNLLTYTDYSELSIVLKTNPTALEFANALMKVIQHFFTLKDDQNQPANERAKEFVVQVPINMMAAAQAAVSAAFYAVPGGGQVDNLFKNAKFKVEIEPNARLTFDDSFVVMRSDSRAKALIRQEEIEPEPKILGAGSDHEFKNKEWLFSVESTRGIGYGAWHQAIKATFHTA